MKVNDVVQFNENHKWCGCLGIVREIKDCGENGIRYMIGIPEPQQGTAFIYVMESENAIEKIGKAVLIVKDGEEDD